MPVNLSSPAAHDLLPVKGVALGVTQANIRKPDRSDLLVMTLAPGTTVAGVFTLNRFCAAPVTVCREHLAILDRQRRQRLGEYDGRERRLGDQRQLGAPGGGV